MSSSKSSKPFEPLFEVKPFKPIFIDEVNGKLTKIKNLSEKNEFSEEIQDEMREYLENAMRFHALLSMAESHGKATPSQSELGSKAIKLATEASTKLNRLHPSRGSSNDLESSYAACSDALEAIKSFAESLSGSQSNASASSTMKG